MPGCWARCEHAARPPAASHTRAAVRSWVRVIRRRCASCVPTSYEILLCAAARCARARGDRRGTRIATHPNMPARSIDTATLSFGLVSIPVKIYSTGEPSHELHFHLLHEGCGERL